MCKVSTLVALFFFVCTGCVSSPDAGVCEELGIRAITKNLVPRVWKTFKAFGKDSDEKLTKWTCKGTPRGEAPVTKLVELTAKTMAECFAGAEPQGDIPEMWFLQCIQRVAERNFEMQTPATGGWSLPPECLDPKFKVLPEMIQGPGDAVMMMPVLMMLEEVAPLIPILLLENDCADLPAEPKKKCATEDGCPKAPPGAEPPDAGGVVIPPGTVPAPSDPGGDL